MTKHLTEDQLSMWILGKSTPEGFQHVQECAHCGERLARFQEPLTTFQSAMKDWSVRQDIPRLEETLLPLPRHVGALRSWSWAAVGAAVVFITTIPIYKEVNEIRRQSRADDAAILMETVDLHLSRTVPAPMEPILALIPMDEISNETGEIQ